MKLNTRIIREEVRQIRRSNSLLTEEDILNMLIYKYVKGYDPYLWNKDLIINVPWHMFQNFRNALLSIRVQRLRKIISLEFNGRE